MSEDKSIIEEAEELLSDAVEEHKEETVKVVKEGMLTRLKKSLYTENKSKGALDAFQEKLVSRKLLVFLTATGLLIGAGLDPDTWGMIAMCYIGGQSAIDAVQTWRHGK
jgi:hypothetical protein|tara:strand:+ start:688 stop:1014 length:327 start_codon:yes stop_codon:yes gene_type:complete